jgi:hypothetical protein
MPTYSHNEVNSWFSQLMQAHLNMGQYMFHFSFVEKTEVTVKNGLSGYPKFNILVF